MAGTSCGLTRLAPYAATECTNTRTQVQNLPVTRTSALLRWSSIDKGYNSDTLAWYSFNNSLWVSTLLLSTIHWIRNRHRIFCAFTRFHWFGPNETIRLRTTTATVANVAAIYNSRTFKSRETLLTPATTATTATQRMSFVKYSMCHPPHSSTPWVLVS